MFPNPGDGRFEVFSETEEIKSVEVFCPEGLQVNASQGRVTSSYQQRLRIPQAAPGVYLIRITGTSGVVEVQKLVVQ